MPGNKAQRYYLLDVVKIFAVWIIMLHHFQQVFDVKFPYVNFYGGTFNCGYLVELFFMISGFLAIYSSECHPRHLCRDFLHRALRLFPMAVITCVAYWFIFLAYQYVFDMPLFVGESHDLANIVRSILLIPQPEGEYALNNPTWYLATLIQCFIVFELYRYLLKRYTKLKRYLAGGLLGVFSLCLVLHLPTMHWSIVYGRGLVPFFAGIVIFQFLQAGRLPSDFSYLLNLGLVSILLGMVFIPQKLIAHQQYVLIFLLYPAALYYGLRIKRFINNNYIYIYISYISAISFDAYLWHFPVYAGIKFIDQYFNLHIEYTATMMFWLSILIWGLSVISYRCLEKPSGRLTKRIENKLSGILL